jgi:hypothetical protein
MNPEKMILNDKLGKIARATVVGAALAFSPEGAVAAGQVDHPTESSQRESRVSKRLERVENLSGYIQHPSLGRISVEVMKSQRVGSDEKPSIKVYLNGTEYEVISHKSYGRDQEGVIFRGLSGQPEFIFFNTGKRGYRIIDAQGKSSIIPLQ